VTTYRAVVVLDARRARAANREILERYRVAGDRSPDLPPSAAD